MNCYRPNLNVYVIWHPDADAVCQPLAKAIYTGLNRDHDKPFGRGIGIPTYFRCIAEPGKEIPLAIDLVTAVHTVMFVLVEDHFVYADPWGEYISELYTATQTGDGQHLLVPVALTGSVFNLHPSISKANFVRLFNLEPATVRDKLIHHVVHCLARLLESAARPTE